jgi:hypothetical protein
MEVSFTLTSCGLVCGEVISTVFKPMVADGCTGLIIPGGLMGDIIYIYIFYADHPAIVINQAEKAMPGGKAAKKRVSTLPASGRHPGLGGLKGLSSSKWFLSFSKYLNM